MKIRSRNKTKSLSACIHCNEQTTDNNSKLFFVYLGVLVILLQNTFKLIPYKLLILIVFIFGASCNKEQQPLVLDQDYLKVADLLQYCQGSCGETYAWENEATLVKGYILNFDDDSIKTDYYNKGKFFLQDIRNGMFMEIRVAVNKDPVFEKIWSANDKNLFYIKGTAVPITASDGDQCTKGVVVSLVHPDDINFE